MNKADLIEKMARDADITKTAASTALDSLLEGITATLKGGGKATLVGFGTFAVSHRRARTGRNPQTGATIQIGAKNVPKFTAGKALKDSVN
ncbi:MAG TPA: HU family DNA-binding protein [Acidobacteriota bacterium]|jgi:DNA-binding protein HU-beta